MILDAHASTNRGPMQLTGRHRSTIWTMLHRHGVSRCPRRADGRRQTAALRMGRSGRAAAHRRVLSSGSLTGRGALGARRPLRAPLTPGGISEPANGELLPRGRTTRSSPVSAIVIAKPTAIVAAPNAASASRRHCAALLESREEVIVRVVIAGRTSRSRLSHLPVYSPGRWPSMSL